MKIYFLGAISGLSQYRKNYVKEVKILEQMGHHVLSDHILERDHSRPDTFVIKDDREYYEYMTGRIKSSDVVVADVSHPTANIGYEISFALSNNIPVLALHSEEMESKVFPLLVGNQSDLLSLRSYEYKDLQRILKEELQRIFELSNSKFTIIINPQIASYLEWVSAKKGITRSEFVKGLIADYMPRDKAYAKKK